jgi:uncharacterized protein
MTSSARPAEPTRVAVFAKAPVAGAVKTRLVPLLGAEGAAQLHAGLVERALSTATAARLGEVELWCAPDASDPFFIECAARFGVALREQGEGDLGRRMAAAFRRGHAMGRAQIVIGGDCPALMPADLRAAAEALATHAAVITPAEDGGYVLIGLARPLAGIFDGIAWGSAGVMATTRARLDAAGARWKALPVLWDVDRPEDYARLKGAGLAVGNALS